MVKNYKLLLNVLIVGIIFLSGCNEQENRNVDFMSSSIQINSNEEGNVGLTEEEAKEIGVSVGLKNRELLSDISDPDEPAILVNGIAITKRTIAYQKALQIYPGIRPLKDEIVSIVRLKVVQSEAIKLNIQPSQEKVDAYLQEEMYTLKNGNFGIDFELGYIEGMGITIEEYIESRKQLVCDMFQRSELWLFNPQKNRSQEEYVDELVKRAKIEILDPEMKQIFSQTISE